MKETKKFCSRPFEWFEIHDRKAKFCCSGWTNIREIDMEGKSVEEIWNHKSAQKFRASILDGSFRYCKANECPFLGQKDLPHWQPGGSPIKNVNEVSDPRLRKIIDQNLTVLDDGPIVLNCGYDNTCNISCPSCRKSIIALKGDKIEAENAFQGQLFNEIGDMLKMLYITGTGDPFSSVVYRKLLRELKHEDYPNLEIHLHTNGLLWTPQNWEAMSGINQQITSAHISIDAASPEIYTINRRGGCWNTLMKNLDFISQLRRNGPINFVMISFVVQANNYRQMPDFIALGEKFGFDLALFTTIRDWGVMSKKDFLRCAIASPAHPEHSQFLDRLQDDCFDRPIAGLGTLTRFRQAAVSRPKWKRRMCESKAAKLFYRIYNFLTRARLRWQRI